jgi:ABC-type multidrug transport system ATPase subunit
MLNKIKAINNYGVEVKDIERIEDNIFTINNGEMYYVLTDNEAQEMYEEIEKDLINELGLEGFTEYAQQYIIDNCLNIDWFNDTMTESNENYVYDLEEEDLQELLDDYGVATAEDLIYEFNSQYENGYQWYKETFGTEDMQYLIDKHDLLDIDAIIEFCQEVDGRGHMIASYDGEENIIEVEGEEYYIYRIN